MTKASKEIKRERSRKWRENNREQKRRWSKEYYKRTKDRRKEYQETNKDLIREQKKEWRENNLDSNRECQKEYRKSPVIFDTCAHQINFVEKTRRDPNNKILLQVKCTYCGKWYNPSIGEIYNRISVLVGSSRGECRLYCSRGCKKECSIYNQTKWPKGFKEITSREVQPELRQMVFERDNYECQICSGTKSLHCHHITGVEQNPIESADVDNCITLCKDCHIWVHSKEGCRYYDLRREVCENE